jgi:hypothetical protein
MQCQGKKKIMMHPHPTTFRQPAIPAVGFLHGTLAGPDTPDLADIACGPGSAPFADARDPSVACLRTDDRRRARLPKWLDYAAAAFIVTAVAFGPALTWLLAR